MAESSVNGVHNTDVEMKEEGAESIISQVAPPFQSEEQPTAAGASSFDPVQSSNDYLSQLDGTADHQEAQEPQAPVAQAPLEAAHTAQFSTASLPGTETFTPISQPTSASQAPVPSAVQFQAPISAPTPPAVRESSRPSSLPPAGVAPPERPNAHGAPTRIYLNQNVTPHLLEGMKYLAAYEPDKPLKWLSEFLAKRSVETEGDL